MKINKVSRWIYSILMLMPFIYSLMYFLVCAFTRSVAVGDALGDIYSVITNGFNIFFDSNDWITSLPMYEAFDSFIQLISGNVEVPFVISYFTYSVFISVAYLCYEVLIVFISMARKFLNSFVSKEF